MAGRRITWCLTGAGHWLEESVSLALTLEGIDFFLSRAAEEVLRLYRLEERLQGRPLFRDRMASAPLSGRFAQGVYRALVIAPATSNTVAKCVLGLSDSLVSTFFAQAGKSDVPVAVLPTDTVPYLLSRDPAGRSVAVRPRAIDLERVEQLASFDGVTVVRRPGDLARWLETLP